MESASEETLLEGHLTGIIIRAFFRVYDRLGYGFLEQVYCRALAIELRKEGVDVVLEAPIDVWYDGECVGKYRTDLLVESRVVVEVKASEFLTQPNRKQSLNCLRASTCEVGLLLHFGPKARFERRVFTNAQKPNLRPA